MIIVGLVAFLFLGGSLGYLIESIREENKMSRMISTFARFGIALAIVSLSLSVIGSSLGLAIATFVKISACAYVLKHGLNLKQNDFIDIINAPAKCAVFFWDQVKSNFSVAQ